MSLSCNLYSDWLIRIGVGFLIFIICQLLIVEDDISPIDFSESDAQNWYENLKFKRNKINREGRVCAQNKIIEQSFVQFFFVARQLKDRQAKSHKVSNSLHIHIPQNPSVKDSEMGV